MHIGMLAPISWRVPPRHYGPWEQVVSLLTEGLVRRGVEVTLFATADSITQARLVSVCPRPYSEDPSLDPKVWEALHIAEAFAHASAFDLIHNHFDFLPLTYSGLVETPVLTTIHGFSSERILPVYQRYNDSTYYVSISDADRHPSLNYLATIHHGIDLGQFPFRAEPGEYLLFFGRIHPEKGVREAIEVAQRAGRRLLLAGIIQDEGYYERQIRPRIDCDRVRYLGSVGPERRAQLLGEAYALLHLVNFEEPFGLSLIEAMACGTPVIAAPRGAIPEIVQDGVTGFLVRNQEAAIEALAHVADLDRRRIRAHVETHFTCDRMVEDYLRVYQRVLEIDRGRRAERAIPIG